MTSIQQALITLALLGLLYAGWREHEVRVITAQVNNRIERKAEHLNATANAARNRADTPDALERLRKHYCRDCEPKTGLLGQKSSLAKNYSE